MLQIWKSDPSKLQQMIQWCLNNPFHSDSKLENKMKEKDFGNELMSSLPNNVITGNWTTTCVESIVGFILQSLYGKVDRNTYWPKDLAHKAGNVGISPDFENNVAIWEVKARTWNTNGSAGDKIFATPWKYGALAEFRDKPVCILLVARQEQEMREKYGMFTTNMSTFHRNQISYWESQNIHFVPFSRLLTHYCRKKCDNLN